MQNQMIRSGLFGRPLSNSLSPDVFDIFARLLGIGIRYELRETTPSGLASEIAAAGAEGWKGFNVTIPYKQTLLPMLNMTDPAARAAGAVNAVRFGRTGLEGFNTDARALLQALEEHNIQVQGKKAVIFGAGGAAGAAGWALGRARAAEVSILARSSATALSLRLGECFPSTVFTTGPFAAPDKMPDIAVNATPLGMYAPGKPPLAPDPGCALVDFAYVPGGTEFLRADGAPRVDGLELLVNQAALSLKYWTGLPGGDIVKFSREALGLLRKRTERRS